MIKKKRELSFQAAFMTFTCDPSMNEKQTNLKTEAD